MTKSYLVWAFIGMIGYSVTALLVKLATQSGRFSSYFVLMISSAMVVITSTTITFLRGEMKTLSRENLVSVDGVFVLARRGPIQARLRSVRGALLKGPQLGQAPQRRS